MASTEDLLVMLLIYRHLRRKKMRKKRRKIGADPVSEHRLTQSHFDTLFKQLRENDSRFFSYFRMSTSSFDELCSCVQPGIEKQVTKFNNALPVHARVCLTLRFLATGNSFRSIALEFRVGRSTISDIVWETCLTMWSALKDKAMPVPTTEDWTRISEEFKTRAHFPNCIGAVGGRHIRIVKPDHSETNYMCVTYENFFSVILLSLADANYHFVFVDVGSYGKSADSNIFRQSELYDQMVSGSLDLPGEEPLPDFRTEIPVPHVFVGDEAFALSNNIMRPFAKKSIDGRRQAFNYRLSKAHRFHECANGILSNMWQVLQTEINLDPDFVEVVVRATCVLHNFVLQRDGFRFEDTLTCDLMNIPAIGTGNRSMRANEIRDYFADYFTSPSGSVPWQSDVI